MSPPPIQWLPVFEACSRLLSFKLAAQELCVSPPAVSQQIKVLEEYLGMSLFDRSQRTLRLTQAGEYYAKVAQDVIGRHISGYQEFERTFQTQTVQVSTPIFIAQELLIPNYMSFKHVAPDLELRIVTGNDYVDFDIEPVDAAIRFGAGNWSGLTQRLLCEVGLQLVCSQQYLLDNKLSAKDFLPREVLHEQVLLSLFEDLKDWHTLLPDLSSPKKIICDSYLSAITSAQEGLGIAVGLTPVINRLVNTGRLVALSVEPATTDLAYWLVSPASRDNDKRIQSFYSWVKPLFDGLTKPLNGS